MASVTVSKLVQAPIADVWSSWDDFANIAKFNPNLNGSYLLQNSVATGVGAQRQCDLADGKNYIRERIIDYTTEKLIVVDIYEGTLPLKSAKATFTFWEAAAAKTEVNMTMEFTPKYGLFGRLMLPMMKPKFRSMLQALLDANANYVERGETIARAA